MLGHFVELPYTLVQDYTLTRVLGESTPRLWLDKVDFIRRFNGMALVITHPDYLRDKTNWAVYHDFLTHMRTLESEWWHDLSREAAAWWKRRQSASDLDTGHIVLTQDSIELC